MNVYIATSLTNVLSHNLLRDELKSRYGIGLSYDWTISDMNDSDSISRAQKASNELGGIRYADVVVVLLPGGRGTHVEFGYALALGKPIIVHGPDEQVCGEPGECIFWALDGHDIIRMSAHSHDFDPITHRQIDYRFESDVARLAALVAQRVTVVKNMGLLSTGRSVTSRDNDEDIGYQRWQEL